MKIVRRGSLAGDVDLSVQRSVNRPCPSTTLRVVPLPLWGRIAYVRNRSLAARSGSERPVRGGKPSCSLPESVTLYTPFNGDGKLSRRFVRHFSNSAILAQSIRRYDRECRDYPPCFLRTCRPTKNPNHAEPGQIRIPKSRNLPPIKDAPIVNNNETMLIDELVTIPVFLDVYEAHNAIIIIARL